VKRRSFLETVLGGWSLLLVGTVVGGIVQYLLPRREGGAAHEMIPIGTVDELLRPGEARIIRLGKAPVMVERTATGQYKAFSARCTHLGCTIQFMDDKLSPHFACNCHGSQFDMNGKNIAGPAPRPLDPYRITQRGSTLLIAAG
jgi:Rieske Fe-S protein